MWIIYLFFFFDFHIQWAKFCSLSCAPCWSPPMQRRTGFDLPCPPKFNQGFQHCIQICQIVSLLKNVIRHCLLPCNSWVPLTCVLEVRVCAPCQVLEGWGWNVLVCLMEWSMGWVWICCGFERRLGSSPSEDCTWYLTVPNSCGCAAFVVRLGQKKQAKWEAFKIACPHHPLPIREKRHM